MKLANNNGGPLTASQDQGKSEQGQIQDQLSSLFWLEDRPRNDAQCLLSLQRLQEIQQQQQQHQDTKACREAVTLKDPSSELEMYHDATAGALRDASGAVWQDADWPAVASAQLQTEVQQVREQQAERLTTEADQAARGGAGRRLWENACEGVRRELRAERRELQDAIARWQLEAERGLAQRLQDELPAAIRPLEAAVRETLRPHLQALRDEYQSEVQQLQLQLRDMEESLKAAELREQQLCQLLEVRCNSSSHQHPSTAISEVDLHLMTPAAAAGLSAPLPPPSPPHLQARGRNSATRSHCSMDNGSGVAFSVDDVSGSSSNTLRQLSLEGLMSPPCCPCAAGMWYSSVGGAHQCNSRPTSFVKIPPIASPFAQAAIQTTISRRMSTSAFRSASISTGGLAPAASAPPSSYCGSLSLTASGHCAVASSALTSTNPTPTTAASPGSIRSACSTPAAFVADPAAAVPSTAATASIKGHKSIARSHTFHSSPLHNPNAPTYPPSSRPGAPWRPKITWQPSLSVRLGPLQSRSDRREKLETTLKEVLQRLGLPSSRQPGYALARGLRAAVDCLPDRENDALSRIQSELLQARHVSVSELAALCGMLTGRMPDLGDDSGGRSGKGRGVSGGGGGGYAAGTNGGNGAVRSDGGSVRSNEDVCSVEWQQRHHAAAALAPALLELLRQLDEQQRMHIRLLSVLNDAAPLTFLDA